MEGSRMTKICKQNRKTKKNKSHRCFWRIRSPGVRFYLPSCRGNSQGECRENRERGISKTFQGRPFTPDSPVYFLCSSADETSQPGFCEEFCWARSHVGTWHWRTKKWMQGFSTLKLSDSLRSNASSLYLFCFFLTFVSSFFALLLFFFIIVSSFFAVTASKFVLRAVGKGAGHC